MTENSRVPASGKEAESSGSTPTERKLDDGQYADHWIIPENERAKGFIRPLRDVYIHEKCGTETKMGIHIAESYAVNPSFYGSTFCIGCRHYFPVGEHGEFIWKDGTKVGT